MATQNFKYWAFISYSHDDEAFATKLHRSLEQYSLPAHVRRANNLPRRLIPIFRDVDELEAASHLTDKLERALDESRWLIVVCSPRSAASRYVNQEVDYFLARHGVDRVLCVLAEGEPPECFPEAVRNSGVEPLAADCREGRDCDAAKLKLIAAMAVVGYTDLRNREAQRKRRERIALATAASVIAAGSLAYWDLFVRKHVDYYANYVRHYGIWQGVDRISAQTAERRFASYRFTRHGRLHPPERVDYFHGCGSLERHGMTDIADNPRDAWDAFDIAARAMCSAEFQYHGDGSIASESMVNRHGRAVVTLTYTTPALAQFTLGGFASASSAGGMRYVQFERDPQGRERALRFFYDQDTPRTNDRDHFGYRLDYDEAGHVVRKSVLDDRGFETGEVTRNSYDAAGNLVEAAYFDGDGKPRTDASGFARVRYRFDGDANEIEESYFDEIGRPTPDQNGVYRYAKVWDGRGNYTQERYLDAAGKPVLSRYGVAGEHDHYDARNFLVRREFIDAEGRITRDSEGVAIYELDYNDRGAVTEERRLDPEGHLATSNLNFAIARYEYDADGRLVLAKFFDPQGLPANTKYGAAIGNDYNRRGDIMSFKFFDADGKPFVREDRGYAQVLIQRDESGVAVSSTFLDASLQPRRGPRQHAFTQRKHDDFGQVTEVRFLDADRKPMRAREGYAISRLRYDHDGNQAEIRYYDTDESPQAIPVEGFGWQAQYDHQRRVTVKTYLDRDGNPSVGDRGYAAVRYTYGSGGRVLAETYLDPAGNSITGDRLAAASFSYDNRGRQIEQRYLDGDGAPIAGPLGFASFKTEYDDVGRLVAELHLDTKGQPVDDRVAGWATRALSYGSEGLKSRYLSAAGAEVTPKP
jgi:YD repeat-containing protein